MNRKRIAFVIDTLEIGGTEKSLLEIVPRLKGEFDVEMISLFHGESLRSEFEARGVKVTALRLASPFQPIRNIRAVRRLLMTHAPDVIVAHLFFAEFYCRLACLGTKFRLIGTFVNDSYSQERYSRLTGSMKIKLRVYQWLDRITARRCQGFLANSKSIATSNSKALHLDSSKVEVIYRGREIKKYREEYNPPSVGRFEFINVGRLIERKGHLELIDAFAKVAEIRQDAYLTIFGDGYFKENLERQIADLNLIGRVRLAGSIPDVTPELYHSHCFVFTSHFEGFSGALIEAMLVGMPIISSRIPMSQEALTEDSCYFFTVGHRTELVNAMTWMITNQTKARVLGMRARDFALRSFDIEVLMRKYSDYLTRICHEGQQSER